MLKVAVYGNTPRDLRFNRGGGKQEPSNTFCPHVAREYLHTEVVFKHGDDPMYKKFLLVPLLLLMAALALAACAAPTPQIVPQTVVVPQTQVVSNTVVVPQTQVVEKVITTTPPPAATQPAAAAARTLNALVGAGRETIAINSYFPTELKVHVGDTINWKINSDEIHTVSFTDGKVPPGADPKTFMFDPRFGAGPDSQVPGPFSPVPGGGPKDLMLTPLTTFATRPPGGPVEQWNGTGFASSGVMSDQPQGPPGTPPNNSFQLQFTSPGTYHYLCLIHYGAMQGVVQVVPATDPDVPSQADIDAQAKKELDALTPLVAQATAVMQQPSKELAVGNHTIWSVRAGNVEPNSGDLRVQVLQFGPKDLTIKAGDTVLWGSAYFHTVTFQPAPPPPAFPLPKPQANGPPLLLAPAEVVFPAEPAPVYDPTKYYNSGILTPGGPNGTTWALTFDKPGTYTYFCTVHYQQGMKATITVTQ